MNTSSNQKNSLKNFPADLLVVSGLPIFAAIYLSGYLFDLAGGNPHLFALIFLGIACIGAGLIFLAKLPLFRAGIYFSFGPTAIPVTHRKFYYCGLGLWAAGCLLTLLMLLTIR